MTTFELTIKNKELDSFSLELPSEKSTGTLLLFKGTSLIVKLKEGAHLEISGKKGSGKSMMLKWLTEEYGPISHGPFTHPETLRKIGSGKEEVVLMDTMDHNQSILQKMHQDNPKLHIVYTRTTETPLSLKVVEF